MKNKILQYLLILSLHFIVVQKTNALEQFNFDVTNIEILENGKIFKGLNKGIIKTDDGLIIEADAFEYNKPLNIFNASGNVKIEDKFQEYIIYSDNITYLKNEEIIFTNNNSRAFYKNGIEIYANIFEFDKYKNNLYAKENVKLKDKIRNYSVDADAIKYLINDENIITEGITNAIIKSKYKFESKDVIVNLKNEELISEKKTKIEDNDFNVYFLEKFKFIVKKDLLKGVGITAISNYNLPKSDKIFFSNAIIDLKNQNFTAQETEITAHNEVFDNPKNNPRLKGVSSKKIGSITKINKGIFTSCKKNDKCPPWAIHSKEIIHDKKKKQLIYNNAVLKIYDMPILYFPKFFHPDPTVDRQSGFLQPRISNSNVLGNSLAIPYFYAASNSRDFTFTPILFDENVQMIQTEFREVGKNFDFIADVGFTKGYKSSVINKKKNINHLFSDLNLDLNFENFNKSDLSIKMERVSNDTYLKIFESNIANNSLKPKNSNILKSEAILKLEHEDYDFETGFQSFEDLTLTNNDRYEFILPYYNYNKNYTNYFYNGVIKLSSTGSNELKNTNNLRTKIINDISYNGLDNITNFGLKNNININLKNLIASGKNDTEYKSNPNIKLMSNIEFVSSLPLSKQNKKFQNYITPKISLRLNPGNMKNYSNLENKINIDNIFSSNRIGVIDTIESGESLTLGVDYKKEKLEDINKYFEMKLATVIRKDEENDIPKSSSLNKKNSNLFGSISNNFSEYLKFDYNFSVDNDLQTFESNELTAQLSVNNFVTQFNFINEDGKIGDTNILENQTLFTINENNYLKFNTRRNRKINLTEYYNLVYEYKNDCLVAGIKYNKTYYEDRDLKPSENLFFTISLIPLTKYEHKFDQ